LATEKNNANVANNATKMPIASDNITTAKQSTIAFTDIHAKLDSTTNSLATNEFNVTPSTVSQPAPAAPSTYKAEEVVAEFEAKKIQQKNEADAKSKEVFKDFTLNNQTQNNGVNYYNYNGVVQTATGGPMQNATIILKNTNIATQTDSKGKFSFQTTDSVASVSIAALGYDRKDALLNSNASQVLRLENKKSNLDEVVVTRVGLEKRKIANVGFSTTTADKALAGKVAGAKVLPGENDKFVMPKKAKGIQIDSSRFNVESKSFYNFVKQNIKPEFDEKGNEYKGSVMLSFTVNKKGYIRKIKVEKSLNEKCDSQAIHLLETGPSWYFSTKERRTVVIEF
jgi:hypothetical protein